MLTILAAHAAEVDRLLNTLNWWEVADYIATAIVTVGVIGETLVDFTNVFRTRDDRPREKRLGKIFAIILIGGLVGELTALIKTSNLTGQIITDLRADIGIAYDTAGVANQRAAQLERETAQLQKDNTKLAGDLQQAGAKEKVEEQKLRAQNLATESKLEAQRQTSVELERKLEAERKTTLEVEAALAPRMIPFMSGPDTTNLDPLRPYRGISVVFEVIDDAEGRRAAGNLWGLLEYAGWKPSTAPARADIESINGVTIFGPVLSRAPDPTDPLLPKLYDGCIALQDFLISNGWNATCLFVFSPRLAPNPFKELRVVVGFKEGLEDFQHKKQTEEWEKQYLHRPLHSPQN
jgi:hypothetical protein